MIEVPLNRSSNKFLYRQLADHLEKMIRSGALLSGARLPGSRVFSESLGVSRMTVIDAYHFLEDRGLIVQKGRSGTFVRSDFKPWDEEFSSMESDAISMEGELPSPWLVPAHELARLSKDLLMRDGASILRGSPLAGIPELRKALVSHAASRGIPASWKDVIVTSGGRQGLAVAFRALSSLGSNKVIMDRLNYPDAWKLAEAEGFSVLCFSSWEELLALARGSESGTVVYTVPSFSNPTGMTMDSEVRISLLNICKERKLWILEDDAYGELRYGDSSVPALRSFDDNGRTIYMGSFSQTLFPGMRLGYFLVPSFLYLAFLNALSLRGGPVCSLIQHMASRFILSGGLSDALDRVRMEMAVRMRLLVAELKRQLPESDFLSPQGGIYLWLKTPGLSGNYVSHVGLKKGIHVAPGELFDLRGEKVQAVRLSVSDIEITDIPDAVSLLKDVIKD